MLVACLPRPRKRAPAARAGSMFSVLLNTALGFGIKFALDRMAREMVGEDEIVEAMHKASSGPPPPTVTPVEPHYQ